jgi:pyruvate formate lyase activating enzyme
MAKIDFDLQTRTEIKGFIPVTMLDWEGKVAAALFLGGCNFRCPYCHNPELVLSPENLPSISWEIIEKFLTARSSWIDGLVIGGGEPCGNSNLKNLLEDLKKLNFPVKLETNGSFPETLKEIISRKLVNFIAMDVKTSFPKYPDVAMRNVNTEKIKESINLIISSDIDYEFRTTVVPGFVKREDVLEIARYLGRHDAKSYVLQQYKPDKTLDPRAGKIQPYGLRVLEDFAEACNKFLPARLR